MQNNGSDSQPPETNHQRHQHPPQKSWMPLQYRPPAMVMPHHMMTPQHYIAPPLPPPYMHYHYHYQPHHLPMQHSQPLQGSGGENKTIWVGDLQHWMDETYLHNCFGSFGEEHIQQMVPLAKIFVGGLDPNVNDEDLRQPFSQYGEIVSVKIPVGKGCGFVQFANRDFGNQWNGAYYGGHIYDGYGYGLPPQDPSMYHAAYGAYPFYGSHQQQMVTGL
ncbi:Polyadenylate-binding protein RBP47C' [Cucurbita argyrosperma subsp. argyrosperma]|nr:Polyadenylate-binding protein RBP47C' [Cucurbita argyrosperma subsp. argyrosperma]